MSISGCGIGSNLPPRNMYPLSINFSGCSWNKRAAKFNCP
jgi:hypothetical protein